MSFRDDSLKPYNSSKSPTTQKPSRKPSHNDRPTLFERDVYADLSGIDPDVYEAELREADELYRASRNLDPNRSRKRSEDMTDQDYHDISIDEYRAAVASGQYDRHVIRHGKKPARIPAQDINMELAKRDDEDSPHGWARRAVLSGQYGRDGDRELGLDRRRSTVSRRSVADDGSGSAYGGGGSKRLGIRGSIRQAIIRRLGDGK